MMLTKIFLTRKFSPHIVHFITSQNKKGSSCQLMNLPTYDISDVQTMAEKIGSALVIERLRKEPGILKIIGCQETSLLFLHGKLSST